MFLKSSKVVEQYEDILVEACFGGRDLVELYVKERDHALEYGLLSDAELLAKQLRGGVTAAHIIEANRRAAENQPPSIIAKLAPLCVDLHDNVDAIEAGLNQWDKILSKRALRPEESV